MERIGQRFFGSLTEEQLLDLTSLDSFSGHKEEILNELRRRGSGLSPRAFRLAYPDCEEVFTERSTRGFFDVDGIEVGVPLRQLLATNPKGEEVRSTDYI